MTNISYAEACMISLKEKLKKVADEGPIGDDLKPLPDITLTRSEAMIAYRLLFGDAKR